MRTFDVAYVKQGNAPARPVIPLDEMSLQDITKTYLRTCVKSKGLVSECRDCTNKCIYGQKAISMTFGVPSLDEGLKFEGSLLQKAQMANALRRNQESTAEPVKEIVKESVKESEDKPKRRKNQDPEGWFEEAMASPDPVKYVMERFNKTKTQANKKIYMYRYHQKKNGNSVNPQENESEKPVIEKMTEYPSEPAETILTSGNSENNAVLEKENGLREDDLMKQMMERKLERLMNQQEECEAAIKSHQTKLLKIKDQIETICKTMDILKELS